MKFHPAAPASATPNAAIIPNRITPTFISRPPPRDLRRLPASAAHAAFPPPGPRDRTTPKSCAPRPLALHSQGLWPEFPTTVEYSHPLTTFPLATDSPERDPRPAPPAAAGN